LVIDAGNTRVKLAIFAGHELRDLQHIPTEKFLSEKLPQADLAAFATVSLSESLLLDALKAAGIARFTFFGSYDVLPFPSVYTSPETLGQDRKANILAALTKYPKKACLVISLGTCITYDLINAQGKHLGGDISPGYHMRLQAMHTFTRRLPLVSTEKSIAELGYDTESALLSGAFHGIAGELLARITAFETVEPDLTIILSGGDAGLFEKTLGKQIFAEPHLALYGLNALLDSTFHHGK
jgi:type III pantothenate kinase